MCCWKTWWFIVIQFFMESSLIKVNISMAFPGKTAQGKWASGEPRKTWNRDSAMACLFVCVCVPVNNVKRVKVAERHGHLCSIESSPGFRKWPLPLKVVEKLRTNMSGHMGRFHKWQQNSMERLFTSSRLCFCWLLVSKWLVVSLKLNCVHRLKKHLTNSVFLC